MENNQIAPEKPGKKRNDIILTFVGLAALIAALMFLRYMMQYYHLIG